jgi:hypothetical protein
MQCAEKVPKLSIESVRSWVRIQTKLTFISKGVTYVTPPARLPRGPQDLIIASDSSDTIHPPVPPITHQPPMVKAAPPTVSPHRWSAVAPIFFYHRSWLPSPRPLKARAPLIWSPLDGTPGCLPLCRGLLQPSGRAHL